jgi:hypothetical protein
MVGKPEVMTQIALPEITSGLPVIRAELAPNYIKSLDISKCQWCQRAARASGVCDCALIR